MLNCTDTVKSSCGLQLRKYTTCMFNLYLCFYSWHLFKDFWENWIIQVMPDALVFYFYKKEKKHMRWSFWLEISCYYSEFSPSVTTRMWTAVSFENMAPLNIATRKFISENHSLRSSHFSNICCNSSIFGVQSIDLFYFSQNVECWVQHKTCFTLLSPEALGKLIPLFSFSISAY